MDSSYPRSRQEKGAIDLLGIPVHAMDVGGLHRYIQTVIEQKRKALVLNVNIHCISLALKHAWLREFMRTAEVVFCDSDGVRWGMRLLGYPPAPKVAVTRWIWPLAEFCAQKSFRVYFLGGQPGIAEEAARRLKERYPTFKLVGTHHGYFQKSGPENDQVVHQINALDPDILMVCFGMPVQEKWLNENWQKLKVHVFLPAGAVLDYAAGRLSTAPPWMLRWKMEWLFRIYEEPMRLLGRYLTEIPFFYFHIFAERLRRSLTWRRSRIKRSESSGQR